MQFIEEDDGEKAMVSSPELYQTTNWPYIAPAPYKRYVTQRRMFRMFTGLKQNVENTNQLAQHFQERICGQTFSREEARETVIPAYMGLIKQIDDQLGILFEFIGKKGSYEEHDDCVQHQIMANILVITGWGTKIFFHDPAV